MAGAAIMRRRDGTCSACAARTHLAPPIAIVLFGEAVCDGGWYRGGGGWRSVCVDRPPIVQQQQFEVAVLER